MQAKVNRNNVLLIRCVVLRIGATDKLFDQLEDYIRQGSADGHENANANARGHLLWYSTLKVSLMASRRQPIYISYTQYHLWLLLNAHSLNASSQHRSLIL
jgi:hypothetical protein